MSDLNERLRSDQEYLNFNPFEGDRDVDIRAHRVAIVTTRKPHQCMASYLGEASTELTAGHEIPKGGVGSLCRSLCASENSPENGVQRQLAAARLPAGKACLAEGC